MESNTTIKLNLMELRDIMTALDDEILYWQEEEQRLEDLLIEKYRNNTVIQKDLCDTKERIIRYKQLYGRMIKAKSYLLEDIYS